MIDIPDRLYHYTNFESLAFILKNRTIRFNQLTNTDDLLESKTLDMGDFGKYVFVSCWTYESRESIQMWDMYSNKGTGVRIELPYLPFKTYEKEYIEARVMQGGAYTKSKLPFIPLMDIVSHYTIHAMFGDTVDQYLVQYTDDEKLLRQEIYSREGKLQNINLEPVGKYKKTAWDWQKEWRYKLSVIPYGLRDIFEKGNDRALREGWESIKQNVDPKISYYDLVISDESFKSMKLVIGPMVNEPYSFLIRDLVDKYNPGIEVKESELRGQVRL